MENSNSILITLKKIIQPILENFIVLEGIDGSGTTTQLNLLSERLNAMKVPSFCTFEPTEYQTGRILRSMLKGEHVVEAGTIAYLFAADRYEHLHHERDGILARLKRGQLVICDRYLFSSLAYQSITWDFGAVFDLNSYFPLPGHLFFLDVPVDVCLSRLDSRTNLEIFETDSFQHQVLQSYNRVLSAYADTQMQIHRLDGTRSPELIFHKIWEVLEKLPIMEA